VIRSAPPASPITPMSSITHERITEPGLIDRAPQCLGACAVGGAQRRGPLKSPMLAPGACRGRLPPAASGIGMVIAVEVEGCTAPNTPGAGSGSLLERCCRRFGHRRTPICFHLPPPWLRRSPAINPVPPRIDRRLFFSGVKNLSLARFDQAALASQLSPGSLVQVAKIQLSPSVMHVITESLVAVHSPSPTEGPFGEFHDVALGAPGSRGAVALQAPERLLDRLAHMALGGRSC